MISRPLTSFLPCIYNRVLSHYASTNIILLLLLFCIILFLFRRAHKGDRHSPSHSHAFPAQVFVLHLVSVRKYYLLASPNAVFAIGICSTNGFQHDLSHVESRNSPVHAHHKCDPCQTKVNSRTLYLYRFWIGAYGAFMLFLDRTVLVLNPYKSDPSG